VADVIAVLDVLSIGTADVLGYSMGGAIAMAAVAQYPDRCRAAIVGGAQPYGQSMAVYRNALREGLDGWIEIIERYVGELPDEARAMFLRNDVVALRAAVADDRPDLSRDLAAVANPLLFYAGSHDPVHDAALAFAGTFGRPFASLWGLNHMQAFFAVDDVVAAAQTLVKTRTWTH
jgi:pimeloyl-ACP methyl ester carboxylesterase